MGKFLVPRILMFAGVGLGLISGSFAGSARAEPARMEFRCDAGSVLSQQRSLRAVRSKIERGQPVSILAIGSSSTEGVGASSRQSSYPFRLEQRLRSIWAGAGVRVINAGKGGETADQTLLKLTDELAENTYDLVVWQVGTNDALRNDGQRRFGDVLKEGIDATRRSGAALLLVDPQYFPAIDNSRAFEGFVSSIKEIAAKENIPLFSRYTLMKRWRERSLQDLVMVLAPDQFHMNDTGYNCLADGIAREVQAMVGRPSSIGLPVAGTLR